MNPFTHFLLLIRTLRFIWRHPLNASRRLSALKRWFFWQLGSRLVPGPVAVNFVNSARLLVKPGMTGATQNIYCGLQEFEEMAFLLHFLRKDDLFLDIGANIGSYTILAASSVGARTMAVEPIPITFSVLMENILLNGVSSIVDARNIGVADKRGMVNFTSSSDTANHVVEENPDEGSTIECKVDTVDMLVGNAVPKLIKIDVEGFEFHAIEGAHRTLQSPDLKAIIVELNGLGIKYGHSDIEVYQKIISYGFNPVRYLPFERKVLGINGKNTSSQNTVFVRAPEQVAAECAGSPAFTVLGRTL